jgi:hypothetical protein
MGEARTDAAGKSAASGDAFDGGAGNRQIARGEVEHTVDGRGVVCRALAFHPWSQAQKHRLQIEGKICNIQGRVPMLCALRASSVPFRPRLSSRRNVLDPTFGLLT